MVVVVVSSETFQSFVPGSENWSSVSHKNENRINKCGCLSVANAILSTIQCACCVRVCVSDAKSQNLIKSLKNDFNINCCSLYILKNIYMWNIIQ